LKILINTKMNKKHILILISTLVIGILIGGTIVGIYSHNKIKMYREAPTEERFRQRTMHMINPDSEQLKKIEPMINDFSGKAFDYSKEYRSKLYAEYDSLYTKLKPYLNEKQIQKFEKIQSHRSTTNK